MKKILLFTLPLLAMCFASCEKDNGNNGEDELSGDDIIQFKDPNFLKALLVVQEISHRDDATGNDFTELMDVDKNKDGQITVNEAKEAKMICLYDEKNDVYFDITDISEIKYFTSLETLFCDDNKLKSIDVSKIATLTDLTCGWNELTSLDVSKNTALTTLECYDNQLTSLDLSNNKDLMYLICYGNQLSSLDLSNNAALTYLSCDDNKLTTLNLSGCAELKTIQCYNNQLQLLDVSDCAALESLECYNNPLETLIISRSQENASWVNAAKSRYPDIEIIVK